MKFLFLYTMLLCYATGAWTQNSLRTTAPIAASTPNDLFDLNKYVWSHNNYKTGKTDKPVMNFSDIENYITIGQDADLSISPDGKFFAYSIINAGEGRRDSIVVQSTNTNNAWRQSYAGATPGFFSADSRQYIFQDKEHLCFLIVGGKGLNTVKEIASWQQNKSEWLAYQLKDKKATLVIQNLLTGTEKKIEGVSRYGFDKTGRWLACQLKNDARELELYNLITGKQQHFQSVTSYSFDTAGRILVVQTTETINNNSNTKLQYISLSDGAIHTIWKAADSTIGISSYNIDGSGKQVVFMVQAVSPQDGIQSDKPVLTKPNNSIWYWKTGMDKAVVKVNQQTKGMELGLQLQAPMFTDNGQYIIFFVQPQVVNLPAPNPDAVKVDVWSYKDSLLQSTQPYLAKMPPKRYRAVIATEGNRVIRLEREYEMPKASKGDFTVVSKTGNNEYTLQIGFLGDRFWEKGYKTDSNWLVSLKDGSRRLLKTRGKPTGDVWFSPGGKYLVYFDPQQECNYFSIELSTGKLTNISVGVPAFQLGVEDYYLRTSEKPTYGFSIAGWLAEDAGLLVYDNYDIWQLDLTGKKSPLNITGGYGRKNHIRFAVTGNGEAAQHDAEYLSTPILADKTPLLLKAFNMLNKHNGIYRKILGTRGYPELLYSGPYTLEKVPPSTLELQYTSSHFINTTKAAKFNGWIVKRQSATEAPNYFLTTDFKSYQPLTNLQPQKAYNWLTAELHSFKQLDGTQSQGVLYKPENFDSTKKYPVIIVFYATLSNRVHVYPTPDIVWAPTAPRDHPAWMTSHGYLVFTPDIYFTERQWGPSALNTVDGAARYLSTLPFVDGKRLGACGHSNSGRTAYYVLTHSRSFAAMSVGASQSNIISAALSLYKEQENEKSYLEWIENGTLGTGLGNLWENKDSWLDHTAILHADKVNSPVLLFHNKYDLHPLAQVVEMFIALRRLEKKAWWLNYNEAGHTVGEKDGKDFTIRYTQFFDHYLKGAPPPRWMTQGIPNKYKQIESRYELDPEGSCGNNCRVCQTRKTSQTKE